MEAVPAARRIGLLVNPRNPGSKDYPALQNAAFGGSGVTFVRVEAGSVKDVDTALAKSSAARLDALFVPSSALGGQPPCKGACAALCDCYASSRRILAPELRARRRAPGDGAVDPGNCGPGGGIRRQDSRRHATD